MCVQVLLLACSICAEARRYERFISLWVVRAIRCGHRHASRQARSQLLHEHTCTGRVPSPPPTWRPMQSLPVSTRKPQIKTATLSHIHYWKARANLYVFMIFQHLPPLFHPANLFYAWLEGFFCFACLPEHCQLMKRTTGAKQRGACTLQSALWLCIEGI